jgi:cadmium resistance protein CadD (predicted permease)
MQDILQIILTGMVAFASTNLDDIVILMLFLGSKTYKPIQVYTGQYAGILALVIISLIGAWIGNFIDARYVGLLGLFPIYLAIRQCITLLRHNQHDETEQPPARAPMGFISVALVTMANGGDNIGTYIPLFTTLSPAEKIIMVIIFMLMVGVWLVAARYLTRHPATANIIIKYGHVAMPCLLLLLGIYILYENGSFQLIPGIG